MSAALLLFITLTAADAGKRSDLPAPPVVSVPAPPTGARSQYESASPPPPMVGAASELDLQRLARVQTAFTLQVDASALGRVDRAAAVALQRHFEADPRWRVSEWDGVLQAMERTSRGRERAIAWHGFDASPREAVRVSLRFEPWPSGSAWAESPFVSRSSPGDASMSIQTFILPDEPFQGWTGTALVVEGPAVALDIYEARKSKTRKHTVDALSYKLPLIEGLSADAGVVDQRGYVPWYLPADEPGREETVTEVTSPGRGLLEVRARVNPGRAGWSWVRMLDGDLTPWEPAAVAEGTRERVGWSADPAERFYLQSSFPVPRGRKFDGTVEIWFLADGAKKPERLDALPITIPKR